MHGFPREGEVEKISWVNQKWGLGRGLEAGEWEQVGRAGCTRWVRGKMEGESEMPSWGAP